MYLYKYFTILIKIENFEYNLSIRYKFDTDSKRHDTIKQTYNWVGLVMENLKHDSKII